MVKEEIFLQHAFCLSIFLCFVYDIIRVFRRVIPHKAWFVSLEDFGFWIYCGAKVFLLMYRESKGTLRWFAMFGALAGIFLYEKAVSPVFVKYMSLIFLRLKQFIVKGIQILFRPIRRLYRTFNHFGRRTQSIFNTIIRRLFRRAKNKLTYFVRMLKITLKK